jgi:hypothetical protein
MLSFMSLAAAVAASGPEAVELTVYNAGFALVKEQRTLSLKLGIQQAAIEDVASMIEANSVSIRSLSAPGSFSVLEQNYQYDLISVSAILNKAVGQQIAFNRVLPDGTKERVEGVLLTAPSGVTSDQFGNQGGTWNGMVVRTDDGRVLLNPTGEIEVASIPSGLISRPTLMWELDAKQAGDNRIELSYLSQGLSWKSDYVLNLDQAGRTGDLKGWVTLTNNSGANFVDAKLKLLAGDVMREPQRFKAPSGRGEVPMELGAADGFREEQFSEYHLYTLQRPATVRNREIKQVSLLEAVGVPVTKKLVVDATRGMGFYRSGEGEVGTGPIKPLVLIEFKNDKASQMGMPLPMGSVKVFQRDSGGSLQMLGEAGIGHTPRDEKVSLAVGRAFDIVAERKRTKFEWIRSGNVIKGALETFEIELRNRKETTETVHVVERNWGEFKITGNNYPFDPLDSNTFEFVVELKPNEVKKVVYTVETRW